MNICQRILHNSQKLLRFHDGLILSSCSVRNVGAYQAPGKTTIDIINKKGADFHLITAYSRMGFRLANGSFVVGPLIVHDNTVLSWNIRGDLALNDDTLEFFYHLVPRLDLLIIGLGDAENLGKIDRDVVTKIRRHGISIEILPSTRACAMYNFIAGTRNVAAALIPPRYYRLADYDITTSNVRHNIASGRPFVDDDREYLNREATKLGIKP